MARTPALPEPTRRRAIRPTEASKAAARFVRFTSTPAGQNAQKPDIPIERGVDQFDRAGPSRPTASWNALSAFGEADGHRPDSRHGCKAAGSAPAA
jgi:hypothetical protein